MKYTAKQIDDLITSIYEGVININKLPVNLYKAIAEYLMTTLNQIEGAPSKDLLKALSTNVYEFSGAKVYQQVKDISLVGELESVKSFADFKQEALAIYEQYNVNWLETEYNTAIGQAQNAVRWEQIQDQKEKLPFLEYSAVLDANTSEICAPLDGITLPVDDPFWDTNSPLNHFNCRCTFRQLDDSDAVVTEPNIVEKTGQDMDKIRHPLFQGNSGKDKMLFTKEHPYFDAPKSKLEDNFGLPIPGTDE